MFNNLVKKRKGKANTEIKEFNQLMWQYLTLREELIQEAYKHRNDEILVEYVENVLTVCEIVLGIGTNNGDIEEKIHNAKTAINKLKIAQQFINMYVK